MYRLDKISHVAALQHGKFFAELVEREATTICTIPIYRVSLFIHYRFVTPASKCTVRIELAQLLAIDKTMRVTIDDMTGFVKKMQYTISNKTGLGTVSMEVMYI